MRGSDERQWQKWFDAHPTSGGTITRRIKEVDRADRAGKALLRRLEKHEREKAKKRAAKRRVKSPAKGKKK